MNNFDIILSSGMSLKWSSSGSFSGTVFPATDLGQERVSPGLLETTNGNGGQGKHVSRKSFRSESSAYTTVITDEVINCTANTFTVTLMSAVGIDGKPFTIKNSGMGIITVDGDGAETIDGVATQTLLMNESITVMSDGANWIII